MTRTTRRSPNARRTATRGFGPTLVAEGADLRCAVCGPQLLAFLWTRCREVAALGLITWNLNGRGRSILSPVAGFSCRSPDILALQEVSRGMVEPLQRELSEVGLPHAIDSFAVAPSWEAKGPRRYGLMIAARFPLAPSPTGVSVCWPERLLSVGSFTLRAASPPYHPHPSRGNYHASSHLDVTARHVDGRWPRDVDAGTRSDSRLEIPAARIPLH